MSLGHFSVDFTAQIPTMLYPLLAASLGMTLGMIGLAAMTMQMTGALAQPTFGYLGDRIGRRMLAVASMVWMAVWIAAAAFAPSYGLLLVSLGLAGVGVGAFHPQGAAVASESASRREGVSVSTFFLGGHLGFALGPVVIGVIFAAGGVRWTPALVLPAIGMAIVMLAWLRDGASRSLAAEPARTERVDRFAFAVGAALMLAIVRGWGYATMNTFIPIFVAPDEPDPTLAGVILGLFLAGHAAGAFAGGIAADRYGVRRIVSLSALASIPTIAGFAFTSAALGHAVLALISGLAVGLGSTPAILLMLRLVPSRTGAASGIALGATFGAGAVGTLITGVIGDAAGLTAGLLVTAGMQVLVLAVIRWIPGVRPAQVPVVADDASTPRLGPAA